MKHILTSFVTLLIVSLGFVTLYDKDDTQELAVGGGFSEKSCLVTETVVGVGHQLTTELLATTSLRAWATIQQVESATNTVSVAFDGSDAVAGQGYILYPATTTESAYRTPDFGLGTMFPHTGPVDAITDTGSTTVLVTECKYR